MRIKTDYMRKISCPKNLWALFLADKLGEKGIFKLFPTAKFNETPFSAVFLTPTLFQEAIVKKARKNWGEQGEPLQENGSNTRETSGNSEIWKCWGGRSIWLRTNNRKHLMCVFLKNTLPCSKWIWQWVISWVSIEGRSSLMRLVKCRPHTVTVFGAGSRAGTCFRKPAAWTRHFQKTYGSSTCTWRWSEEALVGWEKF